MVHIRAEGNKLIVTAEEIEHYLEFLHRKMNEAEQEIGTLSGSWQGEDQVQFRQRWTQVMNKGSAYGQLVKALESYARYLRYADKQYSDAQERAQLRARLLSRF